MNDVFLELLPVLVVGYGKMGKLYVEHLIKAGISADHIIVVDTRNDRITELAQSNPEAIATNTLEHALRQNPKTALVLTNSPTHLDILQKLLGTSVKNVFCEKPTALASQVHELQALKGKFETFATGFIINFSAALEALIAFMREKGVHVLQGSGRWQKDRTNDRRPTGGDVEDELIHAAEALIMLVRNGESLELPTDVHSAYIGHQLYVDEAIQRKAQAEDPSFELRPPSNAIVVLRTYPNEGRQPVDLYLQSSFMGFRQDRRIEVLLAGHEPRATFKAEIVFDTPEGDVLSTAAMGSDDYKCRVFPSKEKLGHMIMAFLSAAAGKARDPRLTDFDASVSAVSLTADIHRHAH